MIRVGIIGGTGYTGAELLRILARHPDAELEAITSRAEAGNPVSGIFPSLRGACEAVYQDPERASLVNCDVVFAATPNGVAMRRAPALLEAGVKLIDLSADFRIRDAGVWQHWYAQTHACPGLLEEAVYGLPEVNRDRIRGARLVANPGCYPTAVILGFLPLLEARLVDPEALIADAKSGVSGAGRKESLMTQFCEAADSLSAYSVPGHRHLPEIEQALALASGGAVRLTFVPHLVPLIRGIHATLYARLRDADVDLQALFDSRYRDEPFVDVFPAGSHPRTRDVRGSNICRLAVHKPGAGDTVVVLAVEDNLVKGAAGQAIQNMNLMTGLEESAGLNGAALLP